MQCLLPRTLEGDFNSLKLVWQPGEVAWRCRRRSPERRRSHRRLLAALVLLVLDAVARRRLLLLCPAAVGIARSLRSILAESLVVVVPLQFRIFRRKEMGFSKKEIKCNLLQSIASGQWMTVSLLPETFIKGRQSEAA